MLVIGYFADCSAKTDASQKVSAYLDQEYNEIQATIDLSGGYSCELTRGAVFLYDGEVHDETKPVAIAITIDEDAYDDYLAQAVADTDHRSFANGLIFEGDDSIMYICRVGDNAYFAIFAEDSNTAEMESIAGRFELTPAI